MAHTSHIKALYRSAQTDKAPAGYPPRGALGMERWMRSQQPAFGDRFLQVNKHAYRINPDGRAYAALP